MPDVRSVSSSHAGKDVYKDKDKPNQVRFSNIVAAKGVGDAVRTSLGPRGMDKMIQDGKGEVLITNDGATILKEMQVQHPAAKMLVELSKAQDVEAGDGTTSVVVLCGSILSAAEKLLEKGIHPTTISECFQLAVTKAVEIVKSISMPIELTDKEALAKNAVTALNSKVVASNANMLAPMCVEAVTHVIPELKTATTVDLRDIKIIQVPGGTIDDCELAKGLVLTQKVVTTAVSRVEKAKVGLIQFCLSPPKTDMENQVIVSDYSQMDRVLKEERAYILNLVKAIKKAGCNVLLVQKSILRDALSDLAIHFLNKLKIMVIKDIERDDVEFVCKSIGIKPIASIDHFTPEMLVSVELVEEVHVGSTKIVKMSGSAFPGRTASIIARGFNKLVLDEAERSIHDALCVLRSLVKTRALLPGGGAPEIEVALHLQKYAQTCTGMLQYCMKAYGEAFEIIPYTLAENAGLNPIRTVTELRHRHDLGNRDFGINVKTGSVSSMTESNVVQPLLVTVSAMQLATETVRSLLKIDDLISVN